MNLFKVLCTAALRKLLFVVLCLSASAQLSAEVRLESQVKISDVGLHFDGVDLNHSNYKDPDKGKKYDFFFGRNISAHGDAVKTYKHYVFLTWYRGGKEDRHVMLSRYNKKTGTVKSIAFPHQHTGFRGDPLVGESHNTIGLAVSPVNGTIHMVYDMHAYGDDNYGGRFKDDFFRYSYSRPGVADVSDAEFTLNKFVKDTSAVSQGPDDYKHLTMTGDLADKLNFSRLTYPKFFTNTDGTLLLYMRLGGNNNGAYVFNRYDAAQNKWSLFTNFNFHNQKTTHGNEYDWGLYGSMKYVNGKLRVGFQQRARINDDRYKYQNGVYYAYSDHPEGFGDWKNHKGKPMTWPLINSDEIKVFEPGDYIKGHQDPNSVHIVPHFDWTVTAKGDIHMISMARSTDKKRADRQQVNLHSYKPAGAQDFIVTDQFSGASNIYTSGDNVYIIGLKDGYPYVEKAKGGTNDFSRVYEQTEGTRFDHGTVYVHDGKVYYYLMERGSGSSLPLHLQIIDLDISNESIAELSDDKEGNQWFSIFDGKSLRGWVAKFAGYELGVNYKNTFRVQDGYLTTNYDQYDKFNFEFGHLYFKKPYSHYRLRATYRFLEQQLPGWRSAWKNNGFMIHSQPPESIGLEQKVPASIEVQLLGADADTKNRPTANFCTPYSHVTMANKQITKHCIKSRSTTFAGDQWVTLEIEVRGDEVIKHWINGELVLQYSKPVLDEKSLHLSKYYGGSEMKSGYIAIQAENSTVQFKSIELKVLEQK